MTAFSLPACLPCARWLLLFVAACALQTTAARGDEPEDAKARAIRLTKEGGAAYRDGRYGEALQRFQDAYHTFPATPLLLNLSRAELKLGDCDESLRYAQMFASASPPGEVSPDSPDTWLGTVNQECPEVQISSIPPGATLSIEGSHQAVVPTTPWKGRLSAGAHAVRGQKPGFTDAVATLQIQAGQPVEVSINFTAAQPLTTVAPPQDVKLTPPLAGSELRTTPAVAKRPSPLKNVGWAATAIGGAALVAAVILGVSSGTGLTSLHTATPSRLSLQAQQQINTVSSEALGADVLYAAGGVLAAGGVTLVVVF
jgi:hypothetical protein